ncbi:DUF2975 domain-containing protein [Micrococcales bacterium 31B]|nr:DUF2975 domain-containing protein [Micrococcales bacterium 31B]
MPPIKRLILPARILLVGFFAGLVLAQTFMSYGQFINVSPDSTAPLWARLLGWGFVAAEILCVEIVVVCIWKLLGLVHREEIFSARAFTWVNLILGAIAAACALLFTLIVVMYFGGYDDPGLPMMIGIVLAAGCVTWILVAVLRALLAQATNLRSELDEVI